LLHLGWNRKSSLDYSNEKDKEEANWPYHYEDKDQLEEQEEKTEEITVNQVF
jgi:hypothetical protein